VSDRPLDGQGADSMNAVLFDNAGKWIDLDFQRENLTRGFWDSLYLNDEFIETDASYPKERIFIVKDQAEFDTIFNEFPPGVNFVKETILLYGFASTTIRSAVIERINLDNKKLSIKVKWVRLAPPGLPEPPEAILSRMRWFVVKTDKLNIDTVAFIWGI
jgi:hypothetical protein